MGLKLSTDYPLNFSHKLIEHLKQNEKFIVSYWLNLIKQSNLENIFKFSHRELEILVHQNLEWFKEAILNGNTSYIYIPNNDIERNISFLLKKYISKNMSLQQFQLVNNLFRRAIQYTLHKDDIGEGEYIYALETIENYFLHILALSAKIWEKQQKNLQAQRPELLGLYNIATSVSLTSDTDEVLNTIVNEVARILNVDLCFLLLPQEDNSDILQVCASNEKNGYRELLHNMYFSLKNDDLISRVFKGGNILRSNDPSNDIKPLNVKDLQFFDFTHILASPLKVHNNVIGVICVANKFQDFDSSDITILATISSQAASSIYNNRLLLDHHYLSIEMVLSLAKLIDERDPYTHNHSANVAQYALKLAKAINYSQDYERITMAGLLHDIGKIGIADSILHKPGRLTKMEREIMMTHAIKGAQILEPIRGLHNIIPAVKHHHENYNGSGYPSRLASEDIPLEARILNIADSYDTMSSNRVYRQARSKEEIIKEFQRMKGVQFDPVLTDAFLDILPTLSLNGNKNNIKYMYLNKNQSKIESPKTNYLVDNPVSRYKDTFDYIRSISSTLEKKEVLYRAVNAIKTLLNGDYACFWLCEDEILKPIVYTNGFESKYYNYFTIKDNDLISYVAYRKIPVTVVDFACENRFNINNYIKDNQIVSSIAVPAQTGDKLMGVLSVFNKEKREFNSDDLLIISAIADQTATALENAYAYQQKIEVPNIDTLTGLYNHKFFYDQLTFEFNRAKRYNNNFTLIMLNIDNFKYYNEINGYILGDEILKNLGELIKNSVRFVDIPARYSGEEFAIITPECRVDQAIVLAKRLKHIISVTPFPTKDPGIYTELSMSIGLTDYSKDKYIYPDDMINEVKKLLKQAKQYGGNCIEYN